jgi:hypothetical protein
MTHRLLVPLLAGWTLLACHHAAPVAESPRVVTSTAVVSTDSLRRIAQGDARAGVPDPMSRADDAARRTVRITAQPDTLVLHKGESIPFHTAVRFAAYDSAGALLPGFVPRIGIDDPAVATLSGPSLVALDSGTTHMIVVPMVFNTAQASSTVRVVVPITVLP